MTTIILVLLFVAAVIIMAWLIARVGRKNLVDALDYDMRYLWLKDRVDTYSVNEYNYKYLKDQLLKLGQMQYKNREKTSVLTTTFFKRFLEIAEKEATERISEDEYSVENVMGK